jgi:hypothetical protein
MTEIVIEGRGRVFTAELLEKKAPKTCQLILENLPLELEALHAKMSGEMFYAFLPESIKEDVGLENATIYPHQGEILYYRGIMSSGLTLSELMVAYGRAVMVGSRGEELSNVFGRISGNLDELFDFGTDVHKKGATKITIKKKIVDK